MFQKIYALPLRTVIIIMFLSVLLWTIASKIPYQKFWKILNIVCFVISLSSILYITIFNRISGSSNELITTPFYSFSEAKIQPEMYRSTLMNCFLFLPFGLTLPYALPKRIKHKIFLTILFALTLSLLVELTQYIFSLGRAEVDDLICNTLGAAFGCLSYLLFLILPLKYKE